MEKLFKIITTIILSFQLFIMKKVKYDWLAHIAFIGLPLSYIGLSLYLYLLWTPILIILLPIIGGLLKEIIDKYLRGGTFDVKEFVITCVPGFILFLLIILK